MSNRIEGTTVLICRDDVSANFPGGVDAFTGTLDEASIRWSVGDLPSEDDTPTDQQLLSLGVQDGVETVLDLGTGAQISTSIVPRESSDTPIHDALIAACDAIGWRYHGSEAPAVFVNLSGRTGLFSTRFHSDEERKVLVSVTFAPLIVPLRARRRVLEFMARANHGMLIGGFEFSLDTGTLLVKTSLDAHVHPVTDHGVHSMAWNGVAVLDRYVTQLMEVIYAKRNVREAIEEAEQP